MQHIEIDHINLSSLIQKNLFNFYVNIYVIYKIIVIIYYITYHQKPKFYKVYFLLTFGSLDTIASAKEYASPFM